MPSAYQINTKSYKVIIIKIKNRCELYDAYAIEDKYMFNMIKFDSARNWTLNELKDLKKISSFFGPYNDNSGSSMFFFSLEKPSVFDVENYEYEETDESVEEGHIFALVTINSSQSLQESQSSRKTHYRSIKNLGSRFRALDISNWSQGEIGLEYEEGDVCEDDIRYSSKIKIICDKKSPSLSQLVLLPEKSTSN